MRLSTRTASTAAVTATMAPLLRLGAGGLAGRASELDDLLFLPEPVLGRTGSAAVAGVGRGLRVGGGDGAGTGGGAAAGGDAGARDAGGCVAGGESDGVGGADGGAEVGGGERSGGLGLGGGATFRGGGAVCGGGGGGCKWEREEGGDKAGGGEVRDGSATGGAAVAASAGVAVGREDAGAGEAAAGAEAAMNQAPFECERWWLGLFCGVALMPAAVVVVVSDMAEGRDAACCYCKRAEGEPISPDTVTEKWDAWPD